MPDVLETLGLHDYFHRSGDLLMALDGEGRVLAVSRRTAEALERSAEELAGTALAALFAPGEAERGERTWETFRRENGSPGVAPTRLVRPDGSTFPCEWFVWRFPAPGGPVWIASFHDLSGRERAIEQIRLRNAAIDSLTSGVTIADARLPDLPLIYVNKGFEEITGYKAREAVGRSCRFLQGTDRAQPALEDLRAALREGRPCTVRLRNYRKDGALFWNELHLSPVRDGAGELTHFVGVQIDVTERVLSRQRLEESETRYRTLAENTEDIIARLLPTGQVQFLSPAFERQLGWESGAWIGRPFAELVADEDRPAFAQALAALVPDCPRGKHRFRLRRRAGEAQWVEAAHSLVAFNSTGPHIVSVIRDITLQRKAEDEIRTSLERERELNLIKTRFIRMVSHEFRTPLTGISASTAFLRDYGTNLPEAKRTRHYDNIARSLARMNQLLDDVLFVGRDESGRLPFNPEPVDVPAYCEHLVDEMLVAHPERTIALRVDVPPSPPRALDPGLLHHILQNLLTNALKYSPDDAPVEFTVACDARAGLLRWSVRDRGIGIPAADQAQLFQPFERASNVGHRRGTGLGLHIALRAAHQHGGDITFSSRPGEGSEFVLTLPDTTAPSP